MQRRLQTGAMAADYVWKDINRKPGVTHEQPFATIMVPVGSKTRAGWNHPERNIEKFSKGESSEVLRLRSIHALKREKRTTRQLINNERDLRRQVGRPPNR